MGQTLPIASQAGTAGANGADPNPGSASDSALFALLMADAGWPFAGGFVAAEGTVEVEIPAFEDSGETAVPEAVVVDDPDADTTPDGVPEARANSGRIDIPQRPRPVLDIGLDKGLDIRSNIGSNGVAALPDGMAFHAAGFEKTAYPTRVAGSDEVGGAGDVDLPAENVAERGARWISDVGVVDAEAGADVVVTSAPRPTNPAADPLSASRPVRLSELDLEGLGVKRIDVQVEQQGAGNASGEALPRPDSMERATPRPIDTAIETHGEAIPAETLRPVPDRSRTWENTAPLNEADVGEEPALADLVDSEAGEFSGEGATSEPEWNVVSPRHTRSGQGDPDLPVEVAADGPDGPPDASRPIADARAESRDSSAVAAERRAPAPQPPKPADPPTFSSEPARRVLMMVGDAENEVRVLVHESNGDVSVRFDAPHAIRAHLEAAAHQLAESMSREQVSLSSMTFFGPSHGDDGHSNPRHTMRPGLRRDVGPGSAEESPAIESGLEFAGTGSRIHIRV